MVMATVMATVRAKKSIKNSKKSKNFKKNKIIFLEEDGNLPLFYTKCCVQKKTLYNFTKFVRKKYSFLVDFFENVLYDLVGGNVHTLFVVQKTPDNRRA